MKTQSSAKRFESIRQSAAFFFLTMVLWLLSAPAFALEINLVTVDGKGATVAPPAGYRWTVEEDRTKPANPGQPSTTANQSFSFHTSYMPVVAAGRVGAPGVASTTDPDVARLYSKTPGALVLDANKRYYLSVAAQGFQMGGAPVVFGAGGATATVTLIKYPVPTAQLSVLVFEDNFPVNSTAELPQERPLEGFTVQLLEAGGTYGQSGGQVTQDAFGNPLGTTYSDDAGTVLQRGTGIILTDANGVAIIKNLYPAKYTIQIAPRIRPGEDWHQTSTIEGTKGVDAWVKNNESPGFYEFGPPGYHVFYGFVNAGNSGCLQGKNTNGSCVGMGTASTGKPITGRIVSAHDARPPALAIDQGPPVPNCWVALNNSATSQGLYTTACNKDSTFTIPNVLPGTYQLVVWDEPLDTIIGFTTVTVGNTAVALGDVTQLNWFGRYQGRVFQDIDGTGLPYFVNDYNRPYVYVNPVTGVEEERQQNFKAGDLKPALGAGVASNIRFRDGSIYQSTTTKDDGTFAFTEVFPFFNWTVAEIDYARFKATSANIVVDNGGPINAADNLSKLWGKNPTTPYTGLFGTNDPALATNPWTRINPQPQRLEDGALTVGGAFRTENCGDTGQCAILLEGMSLYANQTNHIEWGKVPYKIDENGGIAGIVYYGITRAEDDPRYATAENWEPGIPRVQVNVFLDCDGDGKVDKPKNDGTGQCVAGAAGLSSAGYVADLPDVANYPFCWRDPASCGLSAPQKGTEDVKRSLTGDANTFSFGDVFRWGAPATALLPTPGPADQPEIGLGKTDSWDDSIPTDCLTRSLTEPKFTIPYGPDAGTAPDCWDGFRNWNQLRPSVFDGGYAFGRVAGQAELPMIIGAEAKGTYIVEAVAPPGYLHQGNGDKNVTFGDELASRPAALPHECVGIELPVPQFLTLFEGIQEPNPNYTAGANWRKCDMKAVPLLPGMNAAPNFFLFTEAPVAAHGVGLLTDDLNNTFDPKSPNWGEKYAPPYVPISIQDWTGRELQRTYSDQYGRYNFLAPSTFTINPPYPSGVMPNMLQACLNHPGPITNDPNTGEAYATPQIDPYFSRRYTQQCYTLQYLPGKTTYLDTPMLPVAAFASVEKTPLDCECENKTPGIYSVTNGGNGPWVPSGGGSLTIVSNGLVDVPNPAFDPAAVQDPTPGAPVNPKTLRTIKRDYGFGTAAGTVTVGGVALTGVTWADGVITGMVPASVLAGAHQLKITRADNGKESVVGLTAHVGGSSPKTVPGGFATIQAAINAAVDGDLITIAPGAYNEALILDKRVRLQGWGAGSTYVNPIVTNGPAPVEWRSLLNAKATAGSFTMLPGQALTVDPATGLSALLGSEEQSGVLVLGRQGATLTEPCANAGIALRIDGLSITGSITGGGILANGYACNLQISNNRVFSNSGSFGGGVRIGHTALVDGNAYVDAFNRDVRLHHNWIAENGAIAVGAGGAQSGGGGGITLGTGSDNYAVDNNYVCGNFSLSDGAGLSHLGRSNAGSIANNKFIFNQSFAGGFTPRGAGLSIAAQAAPAGGTARGTGDVTVNGNLIQGNQAGAGAGGGVNIADTLAGDDVLVTNNMVINNVTGYAGAVALSGNTGNVQLLNNTVASNVSTATTQAAFGAVLGSPTTPQIAGVAVIDGNAPILLNNILWGNRSYIFVTGTTSTALCNPGATGLTAAGACSPAGTASYRDLGALVAGTALAPRYSVFTDTTQNRANFTGSNNGACSGTEPSGLLPLSTLTTFRCNQFAGPAAGASLFVGTNTFTDTLQTAVTVDEGGNYVNVIYSPLTPWKLDATGVVLPELAADYHLANGAVAANNGRNNSNRLLTNDPLIGANNVPATDIDAQSRSANRVDIGADEINAAPAIAMHVGDLDRSTSTNAFFWTANVTVTVHNASEQTVSGATVTGTWTGGGIGATTCTTNTSGTCTLTKTLIPRNAANTSTTFTVSNVTAAGYSYNAAANHDPDAAPQNSNGTVIVVPRP
jgi:large repetitive protein